MNAAYQNSAYGASSLGGYLEQKALSAGPLELVAMLYAKAISELQEARRQLAARNISLRSKAISKACDVIGELDGSLNMEAGGELSVRLRSLYRYCLVRLLDANMQQADEPLVEVLGLLATLSEGWQSIAKSEATIEPVPSGRFVGDTDTISQSHSWTL
jgi:flagellar secretion chaperone FliS